MASQARSALFDSLLLSPSSAPIPTKIPPFLYGCAWKKERTANLVHQALSSGFRGIDVAAQPRHYREDLAGDGVRRALRQGNIKRGDLFVQTKFSPASAQDPNNIPYNPNLPLDAQVRESVASSLHNLRVSDDNAAAESTYLDCLILHSPLPTIAQTLEAWRACESFVPDSISHLGISNTPLPVLKVLCDNVKVKPSVVQNRFCRDTDYEVALRRFCRNRGIVFQSFWTLTANPALLKSPPVVFLEKALQVDKAQALYALVMGLEGTVILNGTQNHMREDLAALDKIRDWARQEPYEWENMAKKFGDLIGETNTKANPVEEVDV